MKTVYLNEDLTTGAANGTSWTDAYRTWAAFLTGEQGTLTDDVTVNVRSTGTVSASRSLLSASWTLGAYQLRFVGDSNCTLYYNSTTVRVMRMQLSGVIFERITTRGGNYGWEVTGANNTFRNCRGFGAALRGFAISTGAGNVCQNCEAAAGEYGFHFGVVTGTVINCAAGGTSIADYYGTGTFTKTTSASEDTTGSTGLQSVAFTTANYTNVTPGSENLKPIDGGAAQGVGTDMSATYTTDYNGATRILWSVAATAADADLVLVTYNVTYDGNTSTGGTVPVDANDYEEGDTVTIATNSGTLVKTDYTFNGWNTAADGSGTARTPGETFVMPGADVTLYAQWASSTGETYKYVRKGATGTGSGDDWTNAYDEPPATLSRDVVYLFADTGATPHAAYTINDAVDGVKYIEFRKATAAAHGTNTGWSSSYGDGVTQFTQIVPATSYIKINGVVGGGYGSFTTGHGFRIYSTSANRRVYFSGNSLTNIQLEHIDIEGLGYHAANAGEDGIHAINGITTAGPANVTINNCYVHDFTYGGQLIQTDRCDTWLIEQNCFARCSSNPTYHSELHQDFGSNNFIYRYNMMIDIEGTGVIALAKSTATGLAYTHEGWEIYRNIIYNTPLNTGRVSGGVFCDARESGDTGGPVTGTRFYNNTIYGLLGLNSGVTLQQGSDNLVYNNIWMENYRDDTRAVGNTMFGAAVTTRDYNAFLDTRYTGVTLSAHDEELSASPFVDAVAYDFRLTEDTTQGIWLDSPYSVDMAGNADTELSVDRGSLVYESVTPITYGVTYNGNGATSGTVPVDSTDYDPGADVTVLGNTGSLAYNGYTFGGWRLQAGSGTVYNADDVVQIYADTIFYAYWQADPASGSVTRNAETCKAFPFDGTLTDAEDIIRSAPDNSVFIYDDTDEDAVILGIYNSDGEILQAYADDTIYWRDWAGFVKTGVMLTSTFTTYWTVV